MKHLMTLIAAIAVLAPGASFAAEETFAALSPKCDAEKISEIVGDAVTKVAPNASGTVGAFDVTLDTEKLSKQEFLKKLVEAGCY